MASINTAMYKINTLEEQAEKSTIIHNIHPVAKIIVTLVYVIMVVAFPKNSFGVVVFFFYPFILLPLSETPIKLIAPRILIALPFCVFASIFSVFLDRDVVVTLLGINITSGVVTFVVVTIKALLTVTAVLMLIATTSITKICFGLEKMKIPGVLVVQILLTYKYIGVMIKRAVGMATAYKLRSGATKGIAMKNIGSFLGVLLISTHDKGNKIYYAMKCRGWSDSFPVNNGQKFARTDFIYMTVLSALFIVLFMIFTAF